MLQDVLAVSLRPHVVIVFSSKENIWLFGCLHVCTCIFLLVSVGVIILGAYPQSSGTVAVQALRALTIIT